MSGLAGILSTASAADMLAASLALGKIDPVRELGLALELTQYNTRLEVLSDSKGYATKRQTAFDEMITHIRKSYDDAYRGFLGAGMGTDMARQFSLAAANNEKITRRQVIETMYPTNANMIGEMADIKAATGSVANFTGGQAAALPPRDAAPPQRDAPPRDAGGSTACAAQP